MRKFLVLMLSFSLAYVPFCHSADKNATRTFHGAGEIKSVDPVYSRVTIEHSAIKDFAGDGETEFFVQTPGLLKNIEPLDLVEFEIEETKGDAQIVKITKTGKGLPKEEGIPIGQAAQGVFEGAGNVVRTVAAPIAPVGEAAAGVTDSTGAAVNSAEPHVADGNVQSKTKF